MVSEQSLTLFKKIWESKFNEKLSDAEASGRANQLLELFRAVYGGIQVQNPLDLLKDGEE